MPVIGEKSMLCVEQILFATDFSEASDVAESYAVALAHRYGSSVAVAHVYDSTRNLTYEDGMLAPLDFQRLDMRQQKLSVHELKLRLAGIKTKTILREGHPPAEELLATIEHEGTDLVVVGTHARSGVARFVLGSTAEGLIRTASRPVLTIGPCVKRAQEGSLVFRNIVFATDFSANAAKAAAFAVSFAQDSGAHLHFCHVVDEAESSGRGRKAMEETFAAGLRRMVPESSYDWCTPEVDIEHGEPARGILDLAKRVNADLIVLGPRKRSFMLTHVERGVTLGVLAEAECPVLTVV